MIGSERPALALAGLAHPEIARTRVALRPAVRRWPGARWLAAAILTGVSALALLVLGAAELREQRQDVSRRLQRTLDVVTRAANVETDITAVMAEGRGYAVDRIEENAARLGEAEQHLADDLARLRDVTADSPTQQDAFNRLDALTTQRIDLLHKITEAWKAGDERRAMTMIRSGDERALTDKILATLAGIKAEEQRLLLVRDEAERRADRWTFAGMVICGLLVGLSSLSVIALLVSRAREREHWTRLQESEARFRSTFEQAAVGVAHIAPGGRWMRVNGRLCEMLGFTEPELLDRTFQDITYPDDLPPSLEGLRSLVASETSTFRMETRYIRRNGAVFWGNLTISLLHDAVGMPQYFIAVVEDISARKRVEAAMRRLNQVLEAKVAERTAELAASQARQQTYLKYLGDGFCALRLEPDGRLICEEANGALIDMLGLPAGIVGREATELLPADVWQQAEPHFRRCIADGEPVRYGRRHTTPAGERELQFTIAPVRDAPEADDSVGRVSLLLVSTRDVTTELELEARVRQMQRMDAIGQLTAGIAHDFNNLLQAIIGGVEMLAEQPLDDEGRECLTVAESAARRGADLVRRLLAFSRKQVLEPTLFEPGAVLDDMRPLLARVLGDRIELIVRAEDRHSLVLADRAQLEDCLLNLVLNAREAMPKGGILELSAEPLALAPGQPGLPAGEYVRFAVQDTGSGMTPATVARALEPFFTTKPPGKGTGLGLSMVQGFARQSGGDVQIDSAIGKGTTISLLLPRAAAQPLDPANDPRVEGGRRPRVLVVDDQEVVRHTLSLFLTKAGFDAFVADNALSALDLLRAGERCDLMVTDQSMPAMTGCALIEDISRLRPGLPSVLITAYDHTEGLEQLRGRISVLRKPFDRTAFIRQVEALLGAAERAPATEPAHSEPSPSARIVQLRQAGA